MFKKAIIAIAMLALAAGTAEAATVRVRVEGSDRTLFSGAVAAGPCTVTDNQGGAHALTRPVVLGALDVAAELGAFPYVVKDFPGFGLYVHSVAGDVPTGAYGWMYRLNWRSSPTGAADCLLAGGEELLWYYGAWDSRPIEIKTAASVLNRGQYVTVSAKEVSDTGVRTALSGAFVRIGKRSAMTNGDGVARLAMTYDGRFGIYAEKLGNIRSNRCLVSVAPRPTVRAMTVTPDPFTPDGDGIADLAGIKFTMSRACYVTVQVKNSRGAVARTLLTRRLLAAGTRSVSWNGKKDDGKDAPAGRYTCAVFAVDPQGRRADRYPAVASVTLQR